MMNNWFTIIKMRPYETWSAEDLVERMNELKGGNVRRPDTPYIPSKEDIKEYNLIRDELEFREKDEEG